MQAVIGWQVGGKQARDIEAIDLEIGFTRPADIVQAAGDAGRELRTPGGGVQTCAQLGAVAIAVERDIDVVDGQGRALMLAVVPHDAGVHEPQMRRQVRKAATVAAGLRQAFEMDLSRRLTHRGQLQAVERYAHGIGPRALQQFQGREVELGTLDVQRKRRRAESDVAQLQQRPHAVPARLQPTDAHGRA